MAAPLAPSRPPKQDSLLSADPADAKEKSPFDRAYLKEQARWIRDTLDVQVAQDGPEALHSDDILTLDELLRGLVGSGISLEDIRYSRIHLVVNEIAGRATRWPRKLIEKCETLKTAWEQSYGPLQDLGTPLYEPGGRLHGICKAEDLSEEKVLVKWMRTAGVKISPIVARKPGALGFTPGCWWISPFFAYRDGIIDNGNRHGGVVSDGYGAYAIVLTGSDEISGPDPNSFQYRCRDNDPGRYRLTAGTPESRHPVRILRSHTLRSLWKPRAGLRYDGLHKVTGWTIKHDFQLNQLVYIVKFQRLATEVPMETVLRRPWSDEIEDYAEFKRIRQVQRKKQKEAMKPASKLATDGTAGSDTSAGSWSESDEPSVCASEEDAEQRSFQEGVADRIQVVKAARNDERCPEELSSNLALRNRTKIGMGPIVPEPHDPEAK